MYTVDEGEEVDDVNKAEVLQLGSNSNIHTIRIHGRFVAIHHLHVQQVIARGPSAAVPAACIGYSDPQERRPWRNQRSKLPPDLQPHVHIQTCGENG